ncbi:integumentary mucin A.1-like [Pseudorasbora parva]|uniref:integumentary mucin A.1-like n=1 Tax=Pseudorasbora parva TaxID=51549 RepID=UPI00351E2231
MTTTAAPNTTTTALTTTAAPNTTTTATTTTPSTTTTVITTTTTTTIPSTTTTATTTTPSTTTTVITTTTTTTIPSTTTAAITTTTASNLPTTTPIIANSPQPDFFTVKMSMKLETTFDTGLSKPSDEKYKSYANQIQKVIEDSYQSVSTFISGSVRVTGFRPGSIIADYEVSSTTNSVENFVNANSKIADTLTIDGNRVSVGDFAESGKGSQTKDPVH